MKINFASHIHQIHIGPYGLCLDLLRRTILVQIAYFQLRRYIDTIWLSWSNKSNFGEVFQKMFLWEKRKNNFNILAISHNSQEKPRFYENPDHVRALTDCFFFFSRISICHNVFSMKAIKTPHRIVK